jgi:outer membrane murein-binding lipoprotein Lpp
MNMTSAYNPAASGAVGSARRPSVTRINAAPIAMLALVGTVALAIVTLGFGRSTEHAVRLNELSAQVRSLSAQVRSLEQAVHANEQKAGQPDALKALQVQQVQTDALVATLVKDVEALRSGKPASPAPAKKTRTTSSRQSGGHKESKTASAPR